MWYLLQGYEQGSGRVDSASVLRLSLLPAIISPYDPRDIFNADEAGLFFKALPSKSPSLKGELCHEGKNSKEGHTVLLGCNSQGSEKIEL